MILFTGNRYHTNINTTELSVFKLIHLFHGTMVITEPRTPQQ